MLATGVAAAMLMLSACSSGNATDSATAGDPVTGGTGLIIEQAEPRSLDPAVIANSWANSPVLGNSLYGTLMIDSPESGDIDFKLAEDFSTADAGKTFTLTLRDGVTFSDGTPFNAEAVKFGWDRIKDPATASPDKPQAALIESSRVLDDRTLEVTLVEPVPNFANAVLQTSMNWIASRPLCRAVSSPSTPIRLAQGPSRWSSGHVRTSSSSLATTSSTTHRAPTSTSSRSARSTMPISDTTPSSAAEQTSPSKACGRTSTSQTMPGCRTRYSPPAAAPPWY
ncbi:hypothetical protein GCM10020255_013640 [Rhodococcus baikonurensis]